MEDSAQQTDQEYPKFESEEAFPSLQDDRAAKIDDFLNVSRRFNRKNLQQCHKKNQELIAHNVRQFNHIRQQKGYNASLLTGKRYKSIKIDRLKNLTQLKVSETGDAEEFLHRVFSPATGGVQTVKKSFQTAHENQVSPKTH